MSELRNIDFSLSKTDTSAIKGVAILGMLMWHLFFAPNPLGIEFSPILRFISIIGDFCVSAFLFVSGYGLVITYLRFSPKTPLGNIKFILSRLGKFYFNFWFVFLIFVPVGIFIFSRPLTTCNNFLEILKNWMLQIFALSGQQSYNTAWWFNTLIIKYYILFPIIYLSIKKNAPATILFEFIITLCLYYFKGICHFYIIIYTIGMIWALYRKEISKILMGEGFLLILVAVIFGVAIIGLYMTGEENVYLKGLPYYGLITVLVAICVRLSKQNRLYHALRYIGKHSGNMYMIHTFFYYYWFPSFFYSLNPFLAYLLLLLSSFGVSNILEKIKKSIGWNKLATAVTVAVSK